MNRRNKQTLQDDTISFLFYFCFCVADPATVLVDLIFLWEQLVYSDVFLSWDYFLIIIVNIKIQSLNFFSKMTSSPCRIVFFFFSI